MDNKLREKYVQIIICHFLRTGYTFNQKNVDDAVRDIVYFRDYKDTIEEVLELLYPGGGGQTET